MLSWATLTGAAVVLEPDPALRAATAAWVRPTVFHGTPEEIADLRAPGEEDARGLPFRRLRTVLVAGGRRWRRRTRPSGGSAESRWPGPLPQSGIIVVYNPGARTRRRPPWPRHRTTPTALTAPPPAPLRPPNTASALEEITERADTVWTRDGGQPVKVQAVERSALKGPHGRVAIVDGCRTPFVKSGTDFQNMDVIDLASVAAAELVARDGDRSRRDRPLGLRRRGAGPVRAQPRARGGLPHLAAVPHPGGDGEPRLRLLDARDHLRRRLDPLRRGRRGARGRRRVADQRPHPVLAQGGADLHGAPAAPRRCRRRWAPSASSARPTWRRWRRRSPSTPPGRPWASRRRRWPRRTTSPAGPRTRSPCSPTSAPPPPPRTAG